MTNGEIIEVAASEGTSDRPCSPASEGYPEGWWHCTIHLNPETGEMHSDGDHRVRTWIQDKLANPSMTLEKGAERMTTSVDAVVGNWIRRDDTSLAVWEYRDGSGDLLLTLAYEGITYCTDLRGPSKDFAWALYDNREHRGRHRWTFRTRHGQDIPAMKRFGESLLANTQAHFSEVSDSERRIK